MKFPFCFSRLRSNFGETSQEIVLFVNHGPKFIILWKTILSTYHKQTRAVLVIHMKPISSHHWQNVLEWDKSEHFKKHFHIEHVHKQQAGEEKSMKEWCGWSLNSSAQHGLWCTCCRHGEEPAVVISQTATTLWQAPARAWSWVKVPFSHTDILLKHSVTDLRFPGVTCVEYCWLWHLRTIILWEASLMWFEQRSRYIKACLLNVKVWQGTVQRCLSL